MGIKIELIITLIIVVIAAVMLNIDIDTKTSAKKAHNKELAFYQTRFTEVTTQKQIGIAYSEYGVRENGILYVKELYYHNEDIEILKAQQGIYRHNEILLEGNVTLKEREGYLFYGQKAIYHKHSGLLSMKNTFLFQKGKNYIQGKKMEFDTVDKKLEAKEVRAILFTVDKEKG